MNDTETLIFAGSTPGNEPIMINVAMPLQDIDQDTPDPHDELAAELSALRQPAKRIAIIGSRNIPLPHQQLIEAIAYTLTKDGNTLITSGGAFGTNAAAIRGAMRGNPQLLHVILPQTIGQQPSDVQDQLIGIPKIVEHPEWQMMTLADASRLCNREIVDECQQLII
ncbi:MAG: DNA-protecting protein DprA, partial [Cyanobacteria bacterium]|nr:DNA-protecting protein DprA [Cyanobacteriota bacterium]